jgi:hypothetical protein
MKTVLLAILLLGVVACGRACCLEKCNAMLYTCQRDVEKEVLPKCFEVTSSCIEACRGASEN